MDRVAELSPSSMKRAWALSLKLSSKFMNINYEPVKDLCHLDLFSGVGNLNRAFSSELSMSVRAAFPLHLRPMRLEVALASERAVIVMSLQGLVRL